MDALPLNRKRAIHAKWKSVAKMSVLYGGFVPQYPQALSISVKIFCNAFPYHIVFNTNMFVIHSGIKVDLWILLRLFMIILIIVYHYKVLR